MEPWTRAVNSEEGAILATRYQQLRERWQQRWPDEPAPPLTGDALHQARVIQMMAHRIRGAGEIRPDGGLLRGAGMRVEDAALRRQLEEQHTAAKAPLPEPSRGDPHPR
jgi:hypothetical protein